MTILIMIADVFLLICIPLSYILYRRYLKRTLSSIKLLESQAKDSEEIHNSLKGAFDRIALITESFMQAHKECLTKYECMRVELHSLSIGIADANRKVYGVQQGIAAARALEDKRHDQILLRLKNIEDSGSSIDPAVIFSHLLDPITKKFIFGKHKGCEVGEVPQSYLDWLVNNGYAE